MPLTRILAEFAEQHAEPVVDGIHWVFDGIYLPAARFFAEHTVDSPGTLAQALGILAALVTVVTGVMAWFLIVDFAGDYVDISEPAAFGVAVVLYGLTGVVLGFYPLVLYESLSQGAATLLHIVNVSAPLEAFTWPLTANPTLDFAVQIAVVVGFLTVWVRWSDAWTPGTETTLGVALTVLASGGYVVVDALGIQLFPAPGWVWLLWTTVAVWALCTGIAAAINHLAYWVLKLGTGLYISYDPSPPRRVTDLATGLLLMGLVAVMSPVAGLVGYVSIELALQGGAGDAINILLGRQRQCSPDPETGVETCEWR